MIKLEVFVFNPFQENTYLLYDETGKCLIVDPGMSTPDEQNRFTGHIASLKLTPEAILNTHCHIDHVLGCGFTKEHYSIPFYCHEKEEDMLQATEAQGSLFGIEAGAPPAADKFLSGNEDFRFGNSVLRLLHVPGHSRGSLALYSEADKFVITGDALFSGSIGRTDLHGGDYETLIESIRRELLSLPGDVKVYPGHGPSSTIAREHDTNPFLN